MRELYNKKWKKKYKKQCILTISLCMKTKYKCNSEYSNSLTKRSLAKICEIITYIKISYEIFQHDTEVYC